MTLRHRTTSFCVKEIFFPESYCWFKIFHAKWDYNYRGELASAILLELWYFGTTKLMFGQPSKCQCPNSQVFSQVFIPTTFVIKLKYTICDRAYNNRACEYTKFDHFPKIALAVTFYSIVIVISWFIHNLCGFFNTSYRMEIFYSNKKIWLIKQQGMFCAHMPNPVTYVVIAMFLY